MPRSPAQRAMSARPPAPLTLGAPAPHLDEELDGNLTPEQTQVLESIQGVLADVDPEELAAALAADVPDMVEPTDESVSAESDLVELSPAEYMLASQLDGIMTRIEALTTAVNTVGAHQEWTTNTIAAMQAQFSGMMAGGNPLAMLKGLMAGAKTPKDGHRG